MMRYALPLLLFLSIEVGQAQKVGHADNETHVVAINSTLYWLNQGEIKTYDLQHGRSGVSTQGGGDLLRWRNNVVTFDSKKIRVLTPQLKKLFDIPLVSEVSPVNKTDAIFSLARTIGDLLIINNLDYNTNCMTIQTYNLKEKKYIWSVASIGEGPKGKGKCAAPNAVIDFFLPSEIKGAYLFVWEYPGLPGSDYVSNKSIYRIADGKKVYKDEVHLDDAQSIKLKKEMAAENTFGDYCHEYRSAEDGGSPKDDKILSDLRDKLYNDQILYQLFDCGNKRVKIVYDRSKDEKPVSQFHFQENLIEIEPRPTK